MTKEQIVGVLRGYQRMIERTTPEYSAVTLDDIYCSVCHVLREVEKESSKTK
jgi:hypothetical protein